MATQNAINLSAQGVTYYNGAGVFSGVDASTAGFVMTSNGTGVAPSFQATSNANIPFTIVTGPAQAMTADNGYIANAVTPVAFTLPATSAVGQVLIVLGQGAAGWTLAQSAGQSIKFGNQTTTVGTGAINSVLGSDSIYLYCIVANTTWAVLPAIGNLDVV